MTKRFLTGAIAAAILLLGCTAAPQADARGGFGDMPYRTTTR